ncbi:MAG: DUF1801 domain-containing protein [Planctomycetaceae bacterium]
MPQAPATVKDYLASLSEDRRAAISKVRAAVNKGLPKGYKEGVQYGMIGWFVPHELHPAGYHCDPKQPLPFAGLGSQKSHMSLHLMCVYGDEKLRKWFEQEWKKSGKKLDMGKACVRFKKAEDVPLDVISETVARVPVAGYLAHYQAALAERGPRKR